MYKHNNHCHRATAHLQLNILLLLYIQYMCIYTLRQHDKYEGLPPRIILLADAKETSIQRSPVKRRSDFSRGVNGRALSAEMWECEVLEPKLKTSKTAYPSNSHFGFPWTFLSCRLKRLIQPTVRSCANEILERKNKYHQEYKVNICF
jgi:hypothetical protein